MPNSRHHTCHPRSRDFASRRVSQSLAAISLIEIILATAILAIAITGLMSGIGFMRIQTRVNSQRLLAGSIAAQILEMFKSLPYAAIANSTATSGTGAIYLQGYGTASPNTAWLVPLAGGTQTLPVQDVSSSTPGYAGVVTDKLPEGNWTAAIQNILTVSGSTSIVKQVTVTVRWNVFAGSTLPPYSYSESTMVDIYYPNL